MVARYHDRVVDLVSACDHGLLGVDRSLLTAPTLNSLLEAGRPVWTALRQKLQDILAVPDDLPPGVLAPIGDVTMHLPVAVGDYVDGYGGLHHALNMGRILRPQGEPLAPNWRSLPVAYHGRAGTLVASGHPVRRPAGQVLEDRGPALRPTSRLDFELEVGWVVGTGNPMGQPIAVEEAADHIFGVVLVNDWSARDIQSFEYQPLGPFLGKSFATSMSSWVVPWEALAPHLVGGLAAQQSPTPAPYLATETPSTPDLRLQVLVQSAAMCCQRAAPVVVSEVSLAEALYWTAPQQLAHATVNGASTRPGDLFASGTVSGPDHHRQAGSLMEMTWGGTRSWALPGGEARCFLEDGDTVILRGWCGHDGDLLALGDVVGTVEPAGGS